MTEEEKKDEVEDVEVTKDEDFYPLDPVWDYPEYQGEYETIEKGADGAKIFDEEFLGPLRDLPEYEFGSEDVGDLRWAYRYSSIATGLWTAESEYGKLPLSEEECLAYRKKLLRKKYHERRKRKVSKNPSTWDNISSKAKKVNSKIDEFAKAYTNAMDNAVNNNVVMKNVNEVFNEGRRAIIKGVKYTAKEVKKGVKYAAKEVKGVFTISKTSSAAINMATQPRVKSASKIRIAFGKLAETTTVKTVAKYGGKGAKYVGKTAKFVSKKIPLISVAAGVGYGVYRFTDGEIAEGFEEIASGIAGTIPVVGTMVSAALDVDLLIYDEFGFHPLADDEPVWVYKALCDKNGVDFTWTDCAHFAANYAFIDEILDVKEKMKGLEAYRKKAEKSLKEGKFDENGINLEAKLYNEKLLEAYEAERGLIDIRIKLLEKGIRLFGSNNDLEGYLNNEYFNSLVLPENKEQIEQMKNDNLYAVDVLGNCKINTVCDLYEPEERFGALKYLNYDKAEVLIEKFDDGSVLLGGSVNGKLHGVMCHIDKDGNVLEAKAYNYGKKMDIDESRLDVYWEVDPSVGVIYRTALDGKKFGLEMCVDTEGNSGVAFYAGGGLHVPVKDLQINAHLCENSREALHEDLKAQSTEAQQGRDALHADLKSQSAGDQQLTGQYALAQAKCDLSLHNSDKREKDVEVVKSEEKSESKLVAQATPVKGYASREM